MEHTVGLGVTGFSNTVAKRCSVVLSVLQASSGISRNKLKTNSYLPHYCTLFEDFLP